MYGIVFLLYTKHFGLETPLRFMLVLSSVGD